MAKKNNYYVVVKGYHSGIYNTWGECEKEVKGYPRACYQGFTSIEEALCYLAGKFGKVTNYGVRWVHSSGILDYRDQEWNFKPINGEFNCAIWRQTDDQAMVDPWGKSERLISVSEIRNMMKGGRFY